MIIYEKILIYHHFASSSLIICWPLIVDSQQSQFGMFLLFFVFLGNLSKITLFNEHEKRYLMFSASFFFKKMVTVTLQKMANILLSGSGAVQP
jgi:hypothetical protein